MCDSEDALYLLRKHRDFSSIIFYRPVPHKVVVMEVGQKK